MEKKHELRTFFLEEFVKELITNIGPYYDLDFSQKPEFIQQEIPEKVEKEVKENHPPTNTGKMQPSSFKIHHHPEIPSMPKEKLPIRETLKKPSLKPQKKMTTPMVGPMQGNIDLGKLNFLLKDPGVQSIECTGPNKNILVKKRGAIQLTQVTLEKEEIQRIIDEFSKKTRIPIVGGVFKAAFGDIIMTAVISDFVGNKFAIQKKNTIQQPTY